MNRPRLLLAVPAATALVFTGVAPAWAGEGDGHDDVSAEVISIGDEAQADDDAEYVDVEFDYKCEHDDDDHDVSAKVTLKQDGDDVRYEGKSDALDCDGKEQTEEVRLYKDSRDEVENGEAWVTVRIRHDDKTLDKLTESVEVEGVDEDKGDEKKGDEKKGDEKKGDEDKGDEDKGDHKKGH